MVARAGHDRVRMTPNENTPDRSLLDSLLDSWNRNNRILVNLLRLTPPSALHTQPMQGSKAVVQLFTHMHYGRLVFVLEDAPEFARELPKEEWAKERDLARLAQMLNESAQAVRDAVSNRVETGQPKSAAPLPEGGSCEAHKRQLPLGARACRLRVLAE